jgi:hypothetical protein
MGVGKSIVLLVGRLLMATLFVFVGYVQVCVSVCRAPLCHSALSRALPISPPCLGQFLLWSNRFFLLAGFMAAVCLCLSVCLAVFLSVDGWHDHMCRSLKLARVSSARCGG